jgi:sorbitol/mannitol transport system substrate-binding protein
VTLDALKTIDPDHATKLPVPYIGIQYVQIPEFQGLGTRVAQQFAAVLVGNEPLDPPLKNAHNQAEAVAQHGQGPEGASTWQRP